MPHEDIERAVEALRYAYKTADRTGLGTWSYSTSIQPNGVSATCVVVIAKNEKRARSKAREALK